MQIEVGENLLDDDRVFDTGDDAGAATAVLAGFDVDVEDPLDPLRPGHGRVLFGEGPFLSVRYRTFAAFAASCGRDLGPVLAVRCEYSVESGQVHSGTGHQCHQFGQEIQ